MMITCNKCNARFNLEDTLNKSEGTKVRCPNCRNVFLVQSPTPAPTEPENGMAGATENFNGNMDSTDNLLGIDDMLDVDSISEKTTETSEDFDLFSIDDLQEEANEEFGRDAASNEFNDEFSKYGNLEFNVSDMYKTLGGEAESKVETERELTELNLDLNSEEDEPDLYGKDEINAQTEVLRLDEDLDFDLDLDEPAPKPQEDGFELSEMDLLDSDEDVPPEEGLDLDLILEEEDREADSEGLDLDLILEEEDREADSEGLDLNLDLDLEGWESEEQASFDEPAPDSEDVESDEPPIEPEESIDLDEVLKMDDLEEREASEDLDLDLDAEIPASDELGPDLELGEDELESKEGLAETELDFIDEEAIEDDADLGIDLDEPEALDTEADQGEASDPLDINLDLKDEETEPASRETSERIDLNADPGEAEDKPEDSFDFDLDFKEEEPESSNEMTSDDISFELDLTFEEKSQNFTIETAQEPETESAPIPQEPSAEMGVDYNFKKKPKSEEIDSEDSEEFDLILDDNAEEESAAKSEPGKQETEKKEEEISEAFDMGISADELDDFGYEENNLHESEKKAGERKKKGIRKQRKRSPAALLLAILLFGCAGYGAYTMGFHERLTEMGFNLSKISGVGGIFRSQPRYLGEIVPLGNTVEGKFIKNQEAGYLFVIRGDIKNEYSEDRSYIKVRGKLFKNDDQLAAEKAVFAGNALTDEEIGSMPLADIEARLTNPSGEQNSNLRIRPGKALPYTLVFSELSPDIEEYRVEVTGSKPAE